MTDLSDPAVWQHLLITGDEEAGAKVLAAMLSDLAAAKTPDELRLVLIDPGKKIDAVNSRDQHLMAPVITDPRTGLAALRKVEQMMMERYRSFTQVGANNIVEHNRRALPSLQIPRLIVAIAGPGPLVRTSQKVFRESIAHILHLSRGAGIHLAIAAGDDTGEETLSWLRSRNFTLLDPEER